jgi:hypothetical protein
MKLINIAERIYQASAGAAASVGAMASAGWEDRDDRNDCG